MTLHRRSFLAGLGALIAAPAVVRVASLMPVKPFDMARIADYVGPESAVSVDVLYGSLRVGDLITFSGFREIVRLARFDSPTTPFAGAKYERLFAADGAPIGSAIRLRLPDDYRAPASPPEIPQLSATEAAAIGVAAVLTKNPAMSRRFWASSHA